MNRQQQHAWMNRSQLIDASEKTLVLLAVTALFAGLFRTTGQALVCLFALSALFTGTIISGAVVPESRIGNSTLTGFLLAILLVGVGVLIGKIRRRWISATISVVSFLIFIVSLYRLVRL